MRGVIGVEAGRLTIFDFAFFFCLLFFLSILELHSGGILPVYLLSSCGVSTRAKKTQEVSINHVKWTSLEVPDKPAYPPVG